MGKVSVLCTAVADFLMVSNMEEIFEFSNGEVSFWVVEQSSIHLRAITKYGDPVELSPEQAKELAEKLMEIASKID